MGKNTSNEDFIKNYDEDSDKVYILVVDVKYLKIYIIFLMKYHCYQNE